jgi:hypothetical protein
LLHGVCSRLVRALGPEVLRRHYHCHVQCM